MDIKHTKKRSFCLLFILLFVINFKANSQDPDFITIIKKAHPKFSCTSNELEKLVLNGYGALFVSKNALLPDNCMFKSEEEITRFQCHLKGMQGSKLRDIDYYLQPQAAEALEKVFAKMGGYRKVARNFNRSTVTRPNGLNDDWAMRTLRQTQCNWIGAGNDPNTCDSAILGNSFTNEKLLEKLRTADRKHMFSYAIPGGSQHHFGLAIDVNDYRNRELNCSGKCDGPLNENGWYRTVPFDPQHFTFLGYTNENDLMANGLKRVECSGIQYWIPDLPPAYENKYIKEQCSK